MSSTPQLGNSTLIKSGLDLIIHLDIVEEECHRRASGRKVDPQTEITYHMEDSPPPGDDKKIQERLVPIEYN